MRRLSVGIAVTVALCGALVAADFQIGPDTTLDSLALAASSSNYMVVWRDLRGGPAVPRMAGATVSATGVVSADFFISDAGGLPLEGRVQRSTVAFDGNNFLVVWADNRVAGAGIRGARVTPAGAVVGGQDFLIATISRTNDLAPLVVFTGADYMVAWQDTPASASGTGIFFTRVSTGGMPGTVAALPAAGTPSQVLEFLTTGPSNEGLIVFQDTAAAPNQTRATRISASNALIAPADGTLLFRRDFGPLGFGVPIAAAFDGAEYLILSSYSAQIDSSVFKTRFAPGGALVRPSAPFAEVGQGTTGLAEDSFPRAFYNGAREFFFARNDKVSETAYHLLTKRVGSDDGKDRDPNMRIVDSAGQGVLNGPAAASIGSQYLLAWMDGRKPGTQPARQVNVFGLLIDGTLAGDETLPILKAVARARPLFGNSPLPVGFSTGSSTGIADVVRWDFGDGASSLFGTTTHTYETRGDYIATLSLVRAGFAIRDFVRILVDTDALGGGGGPPESIGGTLGPISDGINTDIVLSNVIGALNFAAPQLDSLRVSGVFDPSSLPVTVQDKTCTVTLAGRAYTARLLADGTFVTEAGAKPAVRFFLNRFTGAFLLVTVNDDLLPLLAPFGVANETVSKPGKDVAFPLSVTFESNLKLETTVKANYIAKANKTGRAVFACGIQGQCGT